ncbi:MAG: DUF3267 domain-containing protein [Chloroflexota bacterium]
MMEHNKLAYSLGTLPDDYQEVLHWTITENPVRVIILQVLSIPLFIILGLIFLQMAISLGRLPSRIQFGLVESGIALGGILLTLVFHELTHGLVMKIFGAKPSYGILWKQAMFYATTPGFAYQRNSYLQIALAPLIALSSLSVLGMWLMGGTAWVAFCALCGVINASGAIGDLWMTIIVLRYPVSAYVMDERDGIRIFLSKPRSEADKKPAQQNAGTA